MACVAATQLTAQDPPPAAAPRVIAALAGSWEGTGTLLGRPAEFSMRWEDAGQGFVRLTFRNAWTNADGPPTPVLSSQATYLVRGQSALGVWLDSRPQRLTLEAVLTDSSVVTNWTADAERGRTEYLVRSPETVVVRDIVLANGAERLFAEATYRRSIRAP